jgi:hypothetical protein
MGSPSHAKFKFRFNFKFEFEFEGGVGRYGRRMGAAASPGTPLLLLRERVDIEG